MKACCRMPGRRVKGGFARVPRPLTRRLGEAAEAEGSEGLKWMASRKGEPRFKPDEAEGARP